MWQSKNSLIGLWGFIWIFCHGKCSQEGESLEWCIFHCKWRGGVQRVTWHCEWIEWRQEEKCQLWGKGKETCWWRVDWGERLWRGWEKGVICVMKTQTGGRESKVYVGNGLSYLCSLCSSLLYWPFSLCPRTLSELMISGLPQFTFLRRPPLNESNTEGVAGWLFSLICQPFLSSAHSFCWFLSQEVSLFILPS